MIFAARLESIVLEDFCLLHDQNLTTLFPMAQMWEARKEIYVLKEPVEEIVCPRRP